MLVESSGRTEKPLKRVCSLTIWQHALGRAGNPRTSTNIVSFYRDDRLAKAFFDPEAVLQAGTAPLQVPPALLLQSNTRGAE